MTRFWVKTWVEPGGAGKTIRPNGAPSGAFHIYRSKRPAGFISGYSGAHVRRGQANSTDAEARRVQHPGTVHVREPSATRSYHNKPRDTGFPATRGSQRFAQR
jgi:hypothetical protein